MTLQEIVQILGGVGVIASIAYAAVQLRNNARAQRAGSLQQLHLSFMSQFDEMARNREFLAVILKGGDDFEQLDRWDKARFRMFLLARMRRYEVAHLQLLVGNITDDDWDSMFKGIDVTFAMPGRRAAWGLIRNQIGPKFRAVVDEMVEIENQKAKAAPAPVASPAKAAKRKAKK